MYFTSFFYTYSWRFGVAAVQPVVTWEHDGCTFYVFFPCTQTGLGAFQSALEFVGTHLRGVSNVCVFFGISSLRHGRGRHRPLNRIFIHHLYTIVIPLYLPKIDDFAPG